jgi:phosphoglycolate phosphatase-like HAD superfamily hydrolase
MPTADLRAAIGPPIGIIARRVEPSLSDAEVAQIERHYRASYDADGWRETVPFHGVAETLQSLREQDCSLYIVTNKPRIPTEKILIHLGLHPLFEEIVSRDSRSPGYESKAEMLRDLLHRRRLPIDTTIMIGDTSEDGEAASANQLKFAFVTYGYGAHPSATISVDNFRDLQQLLVVSPLPARNEKASA